MEPLSNENASLEDYLKLDREHVWHPLFQHKLLEKQNLMLIKEGRGTKLIDYEGNEYLDAYAGLWNVNVGYGRQEIADAVYQQMKTLSYYPHSQLNIPATRLADRLSSMLPEDLNHVFFSNSGSEANETALKIARQYGRQKFPGQNRYKVIARYRGYHGFTFGAMSATGQTPRRAKFEPLVPGFHHAHPPYCYRCPLGLSYPECNVACADDIERIIENEGPETVIAVIAEPIIGGGGVIVPPDDYLPKLREICDRYDLLLILDEVITGFGRTGTLFACQRWKVEPDIITLAKGISSGYLPLGACVTTSPVFEAFLGEPEDHREFSQVSTYGGHPVCCVAALANLDILLAERLWENSEKIGTYLLGRLKQLLELPIVGDVRGKGLMIALELVKDKDSKTPLDTESVLKIQRHIKEEGVLVGRVAYASFDPENILFVSPPLILTKSEADTIADVFKTVLERA